MQKGWLTRTDKYLPARQLASCLVSIAAARGADEQKLLRGTGIFSEDLQSAMPVSCAQILKLVHNATQQTPGFDLPFQFGQRLVSVFVNDALPFFTHTRNFGECLRAMATFQTQVCPFVSAHRYQDEEQEFLVLQDAIGNSRSHRFMIEAYCAALVSLARICTGGRLAFHFEFPFERPRHIQEYEESLGYRLQFNQPFFSVRYKRSLLSTPCTQPNSTFKAFARQRFLEQRRYKMTLIDSVRSQLRFHPAITLPEVAARLALSPASLKRKLAQHDTRFSELHDEIRKQQAIFYLRVQKLNNEQSAVKMAFTDMTNFRRAVKRWTGLTPSELREV